jgi:hypothetical protein
MIPVQIVVQAEVEICNHHSRLDIIIVDFEIAC